MRCVAGVLGAACVGGVSLLAALSSCQRSVVIPQQPGETVAQCATCHESLDRGPLSEVHLREGIVCVSCHAGGGGPSSRIRCCAKPAAARVLENACLECHPGARGDDLFDQYAHWRVARDRPLAARLGGRCQDCHRHDGRGRGGTRAKD